MQSTRTFIRSPSICRIVKQQAPVATRNASFFAPQPFSRFSVNAFPTLTNELAPFFRLMDDCTVGPSRVFDHFSPPTQLHSFQPRFDVREVGEIYELRGELPGVESKDVEVEFIDAQTLVIRGHTESECTSGKPLASANAVDSSSTTALESSESAATNTVIDNSDAVSTHSASSYQKPSVEDENAAEVVPSTPGRVTPADSTTSEAPRDQAVQTASAPAEAQQVHPQADTPRYWISERSTGSFQRVFKFSTRVNQEGVSASLKNGILNILVPKMVAPGTKRIVVE